MVKNLFLFSVAYLGTTLLTPLAVVLNMIRKAYRRESISEYLKDSAIGFDQAGGSILYQQENFTISSFTFYLCYYKKNPHACRFMKIIDSIFGKNHCKESYLWEIVNDKEDIERLRNELTK